MGRIKMQNRYFIYFLLIIIGAVLAGGVFMSKQQSGIQDVHSLLRVAFPLDRAVTEYEPTNISIASEYIFLENVFSPLVEMSESGAITPGVAETIHWENDKLILTIRKDLKTRSGRNVTAEDVLFSLKRLLVLTGNTHGNFKIGRAHV